MAWLITFINHSSEPNYDTEKDIALKDIKCGEELTKDYSKMENALKIYPWLENQPENVISVEKMFWFRRVKKFFINVFRQEKT